MQFLTSVLEFINIIEALIPVTQKAVVAVENLIPQSGAGQIKLNAVKSIVQTTFNQFTGITHTFESVWGALAPVVEAFVSAANLAGVFKSTKVVQNIQAIDAKVQAVAGGVNQVLNTIAGQQSNVAPGSIVPPTNT